MSRFQHSHLNAFDACTMSRIAYEPSYRHEIAGLNSSCYVRRSAENEGTFIFDVDGNALAYVPNSASAPDGTWLYYSEDVAAYFGVMTWQEREAFEKAQIAA